MKARFSRRPSFARGRAHARRARGFSTIEMLVVVAVVVIMAAIAVPMFVKNRAAYATDDAARQILDGVRFAAQSAIGDRRVFRLELTAPSGATPGKLEIVNQNTVSNGAADDVVVREEALVDPKLAVLTTSKTLFAPPPSPYDFTPATFSSNKVVLYFNPNGSVTDGGAVPTPQSLSLFVYSPNGNGVGEAGLTRAITLFGPTGSVRYWAWDVASGKFVQR